jgi:acyl-CoA dehydrogenase
MDFDYDDDELALEASTRDFIAGTVIQYERDPRLTRHGPTDELRRELQAKARSAGLLAPQVGRQWGGLGLTHRQIAIVLRASGYSLLGPLAMNCMAPDEGNMHLLEKVANAEQQQEFLRPLAAGECRSAFLMTEPDGGAGSDPSMLQTIARPDGSHWVISGRKWFSTGARGASFGIIMARTGTTATMFMVDMNAPGITIEREPDTLDETMPGGHPVVRLEDVRVRAEAVLGAAGEGFRYAQVRLVPARLTHCMRWWGAARRAHDIATDYACRRQAFGRPLVEHEGVGFMLARNEIDLRQTQLFIDYVARALDRQQKCTAESSMAKYLCSESLCQVTDRCVQVLGGLGVTADTPVAKIFREMRAFRIYDGPSEVHLWSLARRVQRSWAQRQQPLPKT